MRKPNYHFFRFANFLADTHGMSNAAVGALVRLNAHAWQRWQPDRDPFPFLPNDEELLAQLCGNARSWQQVREQVLAKLTLEDGKRFYAPYLLDVDGLKKKAAKTKKERPAAPAAKPEQPAAAPAAPAKSWNEAPAPYGDALVYGLQGFRAVGWSEMAALLRNPANLKEADCTFWKVKGSKVEQMPVTLRKTGKGFAIRLPNNQTITADS